MTVIVRFLLRAAWVLRVIPGTIYITLGTVTLPLLVVAGAAGESFASTGSMVLIIGGGWRSYRRYRALNSWQPWRP
jgi:hypothetical protein